MRRFVPKTMKFVFIEEAQDTRAEACILYVEEKGSRRSDTLERQNPKFSWIKEVYSMSPENIG